MEAIKKILRNVKWSVLLKEKKAAKETDIDGSCCICVEDFKSNEMVKQTPCGHVFHADCIFKWTETKIENPDCP